MLACQDTVEVDGAGPFENRVNEESPLNCGHSYCIKSSEAAAFALFWLFISKVKLEAKRIETISKVVIFCLVVTMCFPLNMPSNFGVKTPLNRNL